MGHEGLVEDDVQKAADKLHREGWDTQTHDVAHHLRIGLDALEPEFYAAPLTQEVGDAVYVLASSVPKNSFGWTEFPSTSTWRFSSSLTYQLEPGTEVAAPQAGDVSAFGEKITIDHGQGYRSEIWPIRAYLYSGSVEKGEPIGAAYGTEINWKMTHYGEPVDPLGVQIVQP